MSESCFSHDKVDIIRRKAKGTLQFGKSDVFRDDSCMIKPMYGPGGTPHAAFNTIQSPVLRFEKQMSRHTSPSQMRKKLSREDKRAMTKLPSHMHNVNNRMACSNILERTLRESKF